MRAIVAIGLSFFLMNCTADRPVEQQNYFEDCAYTAPEPIFSKDVTSVEYHTFELQRQIGIEQVVFENGLKVEIVQQGCDAIRQDFRFTLDTQYSNDESEFWIQQAGKLFFFMGGLEEQYLPLYEWGNAIVQNAANMQLNRSFEVFDGFSVEVQLQKESVNQLLLIVTLSEH